MYKLTVSLNRLSQIRLGLFLYEDYVENSISSAQILCIVKKPIKQIHFLCNFDMPSPYCNKTAFCTYNLRVR